MCKPCRQTTMKYILKVIAGSFVFGIVVFFYFLYVYEPQITEFDLKVIVFQSLFRPSTGYVEKGVTGFRIVNDPERGMAERYYVNGRVMVNFIRQDSTGKNVGVRVRMNNNKSSNPISIYDRCFVAYYDKGTGKFLAAWLRYRDGLPQIDETPHILLFGGRSGALNAKLAPHNTDDVWVGEDDYNFDINIEGMKFSPNKDQCH